MLFAQQPAPDLILSNGKIITVDERFTIAQAVAIQGDRIVAVGTNQEMAQLAGPNTRRIDLMGRAVIPGLIDNHMHLLRAATTWLRELRFDGVDSRKQAIEMLRARAKAAGPGEWVYNIGGWAHQQFADDPKPFTREELDQIAPDNPVALQESYYQVFLNSRALQALGIEANAPDPQDFVKGSIMRDASGKPTGVIQGDIPATRAGGRQTSQGSAGTAGGQQPGLGQGHESSGPHLVRRSWLQRRRTGDFSKVEGAGPAQCPGLLHRRRGGRNSGAGGPGPAANPPDEAVSGRQLYRQYLFWGKRLRAAA